MNIKYGLLSLIITILIAGCSSKKIDYINSEEASSSEMDEGFLREESPFYDAAIVYIKVIDLVETKNKPRLYIDGVDTELELSKEKVQSIAVKLGRTKIEVVRKYQTAVIEIDLKSPINHYYKLIENESKSIELVKGDSSIVNSDEDVSGLYLQKKKVPTVEKKRAVKVIVEIESDKDMKEETIKEEQTFEIKLPHLGND